MNMPSREVSTSDVVKRGGGARSADLPFPFWWDSCAFLSTGRTTGRLLCILLLCMHAIVYSIPDPWRVDGKTSAIPEVARPIQCGMQRFLSAVNNKFKLQSNSMTCTLQTLLLSIARSPFIGKRQCQYLPFGICARNVQTPDNRIPLYAME